MAKRGRKKSSTGIIGKLETRKTRKATKSLLSSKHKAYGSIMNAGSVPLTSRKIKMNLYN